MKGSLRQRTPGTWELTVDLGRDGRGKRRRKYQTVRGTKRMAQAKLRELLTAIDRGMEIPTERILLRDWLDLWMRERVAPNRRQRTVERYRSLIERHISPHIGHVELARLGPVHVQALETQLSETMSAKSVNLVHTVLSGALKHALRMELIHRNPASLVSPPPIARRELSPPDMETVRAALDLARIERHHLYACIRLIAYTGLRRGEALGLLWDCVDFDMRRVFIEGSLVRSVDRGLILEPPKTHSAKRVVDLDVGTTEALADYSEAQGEIKSTMRDAYHDRGIVFAGAQGEWLNPMQLTRAVKRLGQRVGEPGMTVHSLRHFHASVALQTGQNIVVVSKRLGHSNVSITSDIYAHSLPGWQRQAADAFAAAMEEDEPAGDSRKSA